jgi:hypothetical protein
MEMGGNMEFDLFDAETDLPLGLDALGEWYVLSELAFTVAYSGIVGEA